MQIRARWNGICGLIVAPTLSEGPFVTATPTPMPQARDLFEARKMRLFTHLRRNGITDERVLNAMETLPREIFTAQAFMDQAYDDIALPIGLGQTLSQPLVVAMMTQALELNDRDTVLEIGTGSGYQASLLGMLSRRVCTIERHQQLSVEAQHRFAMLKLRNIAAIHGDGMKGWPGQGSSFKKIIITAAAQREVPQALIDQLDVGGHLVTPIGTCASDQKLMRYTRVNDSKIEAEYLMPVRFVPLLPDAQEQPQAYENAPRPEGLLTAV